MAELRLHCHSEIFTPEGIVQVASGTGDISGIFDILGMEERMLGATRMTRGVASADSNMALRDKEVVVVEVVSRVAEEGKELTKFTDARAGARRRPSFIALE